MTKLALVQGSAGNLIIRVANTIDELLTLEFHYDPTVRPPRVHQVSDQCLQDETGAALVREIERQTLAHNYRRLPT